MSFVSNYSGNVRIIDSVLYGDKYFYLTRLLDKNFGCWR